MRIDWVRFILVLVCLYISQIVITLGLAAVGVPVGSYAFVVLFNLLLGFVFSYINYPSFARKGIFSDPDYYRNALIFFLIFFAMDMLF